LSESAQPAQNNMRSLERALLIISVLQRIRTPMKLTDVAREAELHIATTQRILNVLTKFNYVQQEPAGYTMGIASVLNAHAFLVSDTLSLVATPVLQQLTITTGLTASLSVRVGFNQVLLVRIEGEHPLRYQLPVGEQLPLHLGGARVLAAAMSEADLDQLISSLPAIKLVSGEVLTTQDFRSTLNQIRSQGFAVGSNQRELGAASAAVPVLNRSNEVIAALQLSGLAEEFDEGMITQWVNELQHASSSITRRIP
jgi:IclR family transcriptional regulator, acetate operon repressor